jgi:precorrin-2/cobalt-factor-2 C20-methyltransferase
MRKSSLYLPDRLKAALSARSAATGRSEADIIRAALADALDRPVEPAAAMIDPPVPGRFVGVGVGPGDAELLTVQALRAIRRADVVLAPTTAVDAVGRAETIVRTAVPEVRVERVAFAMAPSRNRRDTSLRRAAEVVVGHLAHGREVAWITLGDPLVYSTFSSVAERVRRKRAGTVVIQVPGIMAFQALAARTGTVVADERSRLIVRTALDGDQLTTDLADRESTIVVYKGGRRLPELAKEVDTAGRTDGAVAGELLGLPGEKVGALSDMASDGPASYLATVIVPVKGRRR